MRFDPQRHHRRSIRLKGYDYTQAGAYFVTLITHQRECILGEIVAEEMRASPLGEIAAACWDDLPHHFTNAALDAWVVMPNHLHGIVVITTEKSEASAQTVSRPPDSLAADASPLQPIGTQSGSWGAIIQNFKSVAARKINQRRSTPGAPVWQRNYYERIIRNERELDATRRYIAQNPLRWALDKDNPQGGRPR